MTLQTAAVRFATVLGAALLLVALSAAAVALVTPDLVEDECDQPRLFETAACSTGR